MPLCQWSWGLAGLPSAQNNWTTPCGAGIIEFNGIVWSIQTASVIKTRRHILVIIQERVYAIRAHVECSYLCFILVPHQIYDIIYIIIYICEIVWSPASWDVAGGTSSPDFFRGKQSPPLQCESRRGCGGISGLGAEAPVYALYTLW